MPFIFTYLNTSLPAGTHESLNTCQTCVYLMVNMPFTLYLPHVKHAVRTCLLYPLLLFKPVVSGCISLALH
jgi:hypothetical protein